MIYLADTANLEELKELEEKIRNSFGIKNIRLRIEAAKPKLTIFFDSKKVLEKSAKKMCSIGAN